MLPQLCAALLPEDFCWTIGRLCAMWHDYSVNYVLHVQYTTTPLQPKNLASSWYSEALNLEADHQSYAYPEQPRPKGASSHHRTTHLATSTPCRRYRNRHSRRLLERLPIPQLLCLFKPTIKPLLQPLNPCELWTWLAMPRAVCHQPQWPCWACRPFLHFHVKP